MYEFGEEYQEDEDYKISLKEGTFKATIKEVALKKTQGTGKPMAVILLEVEGGVINYYLVDDRSSKEASKRSNMNITRFFDCFSIKRNTFDFDKWINKKGTIKIGKTKPNDEGKSFFEVKQLIVEENEHYNQMEGKHSNFQNEGRMKESPYMEDRQGGYRQDQERGSHPRMKSREVIDERMWQEDEDVIF